jgi:hypothetical protein
MSAAKEKAPAAAAAWGSNRNGTTDGDGAGLRQHKRLTTARARAALRGVTLHTIDDDRGAALYVASLHSLTRQFDDLTAVEGWLDGLGASTA